MPSCDVTARNFHDSVAVTYSSVINSLPESLKGMKSHNPLPESSSSLWSHCGIHRFFSVIFFLPCARILLHFSLYHGTLIFIHRNSSPHLTPASNLHFLFFDKGSLYPSERMCISYTELDIGPSTNVLANY